MVSRRKNAYASLFIVLLLLFAGCARTVEGGAASPEDAEDGLTLVAGFSREDGVPLSGDKVRLSLGEGRADYLLDGAGKSRITGLPRRGDLLLTILGPQEQVMGAMTLSISEGAVIDAATGEDGIGHITLRRDTDVLALSFLLLDDGSLQCGLCLAQSDARNRSLSRGGAGYGRFSAGYCQRGA